MLRLAMVIGVWMLISGGTDGWAEARCNADIVRTWQMERDDAVTRLLTGWLNGQPMEALHPDILTLTRSEVFLHTCAPPGEQPDGYLSHLPQVTLDQVPSGCSPGAGSTTGKGGKYVTSDDPDIHGATRLEHLRCGRSAL